MPLFYAALSVNPPVKILESVVHPSSGITQAARRAFCLLLSAAAIFAAGCHSNNDASGYGIAWVSLTDSPGDFTSYIVNVDSITLTRSDGAVVTALATVETVDFTKLSSIEELWGTATIPIGTYTSASIVLDYSNPVISVMVNGLPQQAKVVDSTGATGTALTTETINVVMDPAHPLVITPTYGTTAAQRLAIDFNLAASTQSINLATSPATVTIKPYLTVAIAPPDNKLIRIRGPLINSSVDLLTYTVYVRPFYDEQNSLGSLSLFTNADTVYTINGVVSTGKAGLTQLSQSSAGATVTAAYTTYEPTPTPSATAGIFTAKYVVAGSTLEDYYTQGLEGDVVARSGNTLTLRGATVQLNDGLSVYNTADAQVILGPSTIVTADDNASLTGLNYQSVAVGQHIIARGICQVSTACGGSLTPTGLLTLNATGATEENTGSVRLISTSLWGSLVSSNAGNLLLDVQTINNWPIGDFVFTGNGATSASDPSGANFLVNTGAIALPDTTVGDPLWIDGLVAPFGSAPPDFNAASVNSELSVQQVGGVAPSATCGQGAQHCLPASMRVYWASPGTASPFSTLNGTGLTVDLANVGITSATIRIGAESIDMKTLPASPLLIATVAPASTTAKASNTGSVTVTLPPIFLPEYSYGVPTAVATAAAPDVGISVFSAFGTFATGLAAALPTTGALEFEARGTYDRATNTFYAISANVVL